MRRGGLLLLVLTACIMSTVVHGRLPELVLTNDERKAVPVASFGFLSGGTLSLDLRDLQLSDPNDPGIVAFYIRKGGPRPLPDSSEDNDEEPKYSACLLDFVKEELEDGTSVVKELPGPVTRWQTSLTVGAMEEGLWQVLLVNCKMKSTLSLSLSVDPVNPGNNHLSAGDSPLPEVYAISAAAYAVIAACWAALLVFRKNTRVFRAHWLMLVLVIFVLVNKALQSAKYHYKKVGVLTEGWQIGFYIFASLKGLLSILIIVLLASGWMFIKPFLSAKDKRIISIVVPLQVLANIASAIGSEAAIGSADRYFWNMLLPLVDLAACAIVLWTILQTRKHLGAASSVDGKETDVLNKYKLWSSFYIVTLVYIYVTRIIVQLLQASLPFRYVTWVGVAVDELATLLFYVFIGYKFRPYPDNPYTQVPNEPDDEGEGWHDPENAVRLYPVSRTRPASETNNASSNSL